MKPNPKISRDHRFYEVVLVGLVLTAVVLWLGDPSHRPTGGSRISWPVWSQPSR